MSCGPASPGSGTSSGCRPSSRPTCWPRPSRRRKSPDLPAYDLTDLPFLTIDPPGLDRPGPGDAPRAARRRLPGPLRHRRRRRRSCGPGGAIDAEAHRRGETLYSPDTRTPLHPPVAVRGRGVAAARPGARRPCCGPSTSTPRASRRPSTYAGRMVRSRDRLDYAGVQELVDVGTRRRAAAAARGGRQAADGPRGRARRREPADPRAGGRRGRRHVPAGVPRRRVPVESWNEQISLMTGMAAADLMLHGEVGVLRTLPKAPDGALDRLRRAAARARRRLAGATGRTPRWCTASTRPTRGTRRCSRRRPRCCGARATRRSTAACPSTPPTPRWPRSTPTRPRRCAGWSTGTSARSAWRCAPATRCPAGPCSALPRLPEEMAAADRRAHELERECVALMEAAVLHGREGQEFDAVVVELDAKRGGGTVQLVDPAVRATCDGRPAAGGAGAGAAGRGRRRPPVGAVRRWSEDLARLAARRTSRPDGRVGTLGSRRGKSGLHRAGWWVTPTRGDPRESATERRPPPDRFRADRR